MNEKITNDNEKLDNTNIIPKEFNRFLNIPPVISNPNINNHYSQQQQYPLYNNHHHHNNYYHPYNNNHSNINYNSNGNYSQPYWNHHYRRNVSYHNNNNPSMPTIISKLAEDKMKPTFKSIEMILETFNSINMILDSTYSTLYGSFRTITGVADHLIFIRNHLIELALFPRIARTLINFIRWIFKFLGLNQTKLYKLFEQKTNNDILWQEAMSSSNVMKNPINELNSSNDLNKNNSSSLWPIMAFFSIIFGTPYIIWKLLGIAGQIPMINQPDWTINSGRHFVAVGLQNFNARNINELSFRKGQILFIKPESLQPNSKWLLACTTVNDGDDGKKPIQIGVIPLNLVKILMDK